MRQWKLAISLAVVGAVAAPFVVGTWWNPTTRETWIPISEEQTEKISAHAKDTKNCQTLVARSTERHICEIALEMLADGGTRSAVSIRGEYWSQNLAVGLVTLIVLFGFTMVAPTIAQRYWKWLSK